jgi:hypothetical protein
VGQRELRERHGVPAGVQSVRALFALFLAAAAAGFARAADSPSAPPDVRLFVQAASPDEKRAEAALDRIEARWKDGYAPLVVDIARFLRGPLRRAPEGAAAPAQDDGRGPLGPAGRSAFPQAGSFDPVGPATRIRDRLVRFLERRTGQRFGHDLRRWRRWYWNRPYDPHPDYASFKAGLYSNVDPRMAAFFPPGAREVIRLDEVDWGGVKVDGIPPLDHPKHVRASEAAFLEDEHVVFGVALHGEARAYPKRILAWHELARDRLGGVELAVVYCTLCGTVIPYGAEVGGVVRTFGTSGLLYRSNKLMYDVESMSLWSTVEGRPVLGPLAGADLVLRAYPVVTTTWREWRQAHPETTVLSLDTGVRRDYGEGVAYRDYFATDDLMFDVPAVDRRLRNKAEVLALLVAPREGGAAARPVALAVSFLAKNPLHHFEVAGRVLVVVTSAGGASRVYDATSAGTLRLRLRRDSRIEDGGGALYRITEDALQAEGDSGVFLPRVPARQAFWFGWQAQYPETELVK